MGEGCTRCGSTHQLHEHHVEPRATGGCDDEENLVMLCRVCHDEIHTGVTNDEPAKYTGGKFWSWVNSYDGPVKEPWETEFVCYRCEHQWTGKPLRERTSLSISCPRSDCVIGRAGLRYGGAVLSAVNVRGLLDEDDSLNYTGIEFEFQERDRAMIHGVETKEISTLGIRPISTVDCMVEE